MISKTEFSKKSKLEINRILKTKIYEAIESGVDIHIWADRQRLTRKTIDYFYTMYRVEHNIPYHDQEMTFAKCIPEAAKFAHCRLANHNRQNPVIYGK